MYIYALVKAPPQVCTENTARGGRVKRQIQHKVKPFVSCCICLETPLSAVLSVHTSVSGALTGI